MKIAVWRYGLPLQYAAHSTVGGGQITSAVLRALGAQAPVTIVGGVAKGADDALRADGYTVDTRCTSLAGFDAAVILTGPANGLYAGYKQTYDLLATFDGRPIYAQWDTALPFNLRPSPVKGVAMTPPIKPGRQWTLMSQVDESIVRRRVSVRDVPRFVHTFFELCQREVPSLPPYSQPIPRIGYFGADRPGRIKELHRWAQSGVPIDIYGRWSDANKVAVGGDSVQFFPPVREADVPSLLNQYAATLYIADPAYVTQDFVAQRFFENVTAGVPVIYSDRIQPSILAALDKVGATRKLLVRQPDDLMLAFQSMMGWRDDAVRMNASVAAVLPQIKSGLDIDAAVKLALA